MKRTFTFAAAAVAAFALIAAGCGDTDEVPTGAVAVVDGSEISRTSLDELLARAKKAYAAQQREFPKAGTAEYQQLRTQAVVYLVQREEYAREAEKLGIEVTDAEVNKKMADERKQYFGSDQNAYVKALADQGYTLSTRRDDIRFGLISSGIYDKVASAVEISDADLRKYYDDNKDRYTVAESRSVRHILVKTKAEADRIHAQLVDGADFAALAKQSSIDPGSKNQGGKLTVSRGQTVKPFDTAAFALKTNELSQPIKTQYGFHLIQPLAAVKPASVTPFAQVKAQIRTQLTSERKNTAVNEWVSETEKKYKGKVTYAAGFTPPDTSTTEDETTTSDQ